MITSGIDETTLKRLERRHAGGLSSAEILDVFATHGMALSEATLRKYVQLGLLPRSVRVGQKGKHRGSKGIYPVRVIRQILTIKSMMAQNYSMDQISRQFLFMRSDLELLEQTLDGVFEKLERIVKKGKKDLGTRAVADEVRDARALGSDLLARLGAIETKLTSRTKMERIAAS